MWQWTEKDSFLTEEEKEAVHEFLNYEIQCGFVYEKGKDKRKVVFIRLPYGVKTKETREAFINGVWHYRTPYAYPDVKEVGVAYIDLKTNKTESVSGAKFIEWYKGGVKVAKEKSESMVDKYTEAKKKAIASGAVQTKPFENENSQGEGNWYSPTKKKKS